MLRNLLLLFIPIGTGLASAMWSRVIGESFVLNGLLNTAIGIGVVALMLASGHKWPGGVAFSWPTLAFYLALNVAVTWAWMEVSILEDGTADATPMALAEMSWPVFVALFMWLLYGVFSLTPTQMIGGSISLVGLLVIAFGR